MPRRGENMRRMPDGRNPLPKPVRLADLDKDTVIKLVAALEARQYSLICRLLNTHIKQPHFGTLMSLLIRAAALDLLLTYNPTRNTTRWECRAVSSDYKLHPYPKGK